jgi:hypothetical protein
MNECAWGGYLVNGEAPVPNDESDYFPGGLPVSGCNRLVCAECGATVRTLVGKKPANGQTLAEAYDATATTAFVDDIAGMRTYFCRCVGWREANYHHLEDDDPDYAAGPNLPWRCAGHPVVSLPHTFDGVEMPDAAAVKGVARRALNGWLPPGAPAGYNDAVTWLMRLHMWLAGSPVEEAIRDSALVEMTGVTPRVRAGALHFLALLPSRDGMRRAFELLRGDLTGFAAVPDELTPGETLEDALWRVISGLVSANEGARALARTTALTAGKALVSVYKPLAAYDLDWLLEHAVDVARANPAQVPALLSAAKPFADRAQMAALTATVQSALPRG